MSEKKSSGTHWIDKGGHFLLSISGELQRCVSCNGPLEHDKRSYKPNHHCPDNHESLSIGANHRHQELGELRTPCEGELIADGFRMMRDEDP